MAWTYWEDHSSSLTRLVIEEVVKDAISGCDHLTGHQTA